ncbi:helix-turn-helix transcriptional regulator [Streptomyces sp. NPDC049881]|uniref:helix-turn-helix domain-containing protein n=1 Tax=Streptomyces sp. NPDC049881 TaxID=3155778 RepID=UPI003442959A
MSEAPDSEDFRTPLQRFGADVRTVRLGRNLTQKHLGKAAGYTESYVSQVESGKLSPSAAFAAGCDKAFGTNGLFALMRQRMEEGDHPQQFMPYVQLERTASGILDFSTTAIVGLFQTPEYAHAIFRAGHPSAPEEVIQEKVAARIKRREVLDQDRPPALWAVLHEACTRAHVGGPAVMAEQLAYILRTAERPGIDVQVIPNSAGEAGVHSSPFTLLTFDGEPSILYTEDPQGGRVCRVSSVVESQMRHYERLMAHARPPGESLAIIDTIRKEYLS